MKDQSRISTNAPQSQKKCRNHESMTGILFIRQHEDSTNFNKEQA
jgi:hypothetical protein